MDVICPDRVHFLCVEPRLQSHKTKRALKFPLIISKQSIRDRLEEAAFDRDPNRTFSSYLANDDNANQTAFKLFQQVWRFVKFAGISFGRQRGKVLLHA